uniref:Uncharacterized protein n=1 Tax=Meloidogyne enterolobii TaxID=390850 RepID=A0A6V7TJ21_MELEN|nr:unnamed protein product [Meloidogyne enterolobii]
MTAPGNTLVVHVVSARGLYVKGGKAVDVYCSLSTMGKGAWKSKVSTNQLRLDPSIPEAELKWDEHCELFVFLFYIGKIFYFTGIFL